MRGQRHDPEVKAAVVAALLAGQGVDYVAEQYKIPQQTVSEWKRLATEPKEVRSKKEGYDDLVDTYIRQNLETLAAQQKQFSDIEWLKQQSASDLAVLHGVSADKAIRLLEAISRAHEAE